MITAPPPTTLRLFAAHSDALAPIGDFLLDDTLTEIMVNGPDTVYVERDGQILLTDRRFADRGQLLRAIDVLANAVGRHLDPATTLLEGRLPDGSRISVAMDPVAVNGPLVSIRKFSRHALDMSELIRFGTLSVEAAAFLGASVQARANILISGGSSTGKTTLLNACSAFISDTERIVTIEDAAELRLQQEHVCRLESMPRDATSDRPVTIRDLVTHALRMRPDRILVGEVRGGEALDMLQAMNTGHDGSLTTIHANGPRDAIARLETLVLMSGFDLPIRAIRQQIVSTLDLVVHMARLADGSRRMVSIAELTGVQDDVVGMQELFVSEIQGTRGTGTGGTRLRPTGIRPRMMERVYARHISAPEIARLFPEQRQATPLDLRRTPVGAEATSTAGDRRRS